MKYRTFIPGSRWVYFKLYTGQKMADDLLIKVVVPVLKRMQKMRYIEKWFFIRYSDPDFHLRIRLLVYDTQYIGEIILLFYQKLDKWNRENLLWKIQLDTYNRELERYGKHLIEEAESLFYIDSECALSLIQMLAKTTNENYRWMITLAMIDRMLSDFLLTLHEKQQIMEELSNAYKHEFGFTEYNAKQFNVKFREHKAVIESILHHTIQNEKFKALYTPLVKRSKQFIPIVKQIYIKLEEKKNNQIRSSDLIKSYIHMMLNRIFRSKNRIHELILYDFMRRYYTSEIAKLKYTQ